MAPRRHRVTEETPDPLFIGSLYSNEELEFLIEHLGEHSSTACPDDEELPPGVNPKAVVPILSRTYELEMIRKAAIEKYGDEAGLKIWCGFDRLKAICQLTLDAIATKDELKRRTKGASPEVRRAAGAPSLHLWDPDTDIPYLGGEGADSGIMRTMIDGDGKRIPLYTALRETGLGGIKNVSDLMGFIKGKQSPDAQNRLAAMTPTELETSIDGTNGLVKCPICGKAESFTPSKAITKKQAEDRVMKHLKTENTVKREMHRLLYQRISSGKSGLRDQQARLDEKVEQRKLAAQED